MQEKISNVIKKEKQEGERKIVKSEQASEIFRMFNINSGKKCLQIFPTDLLSVGLDLDEGFPLFISKIESSAMHFIGKLKFKSKIGELLKNCFMAPLQISYPKGLVSHVEDEIFSKYNKIWFIENIDIESIDENFVGLFNLKKDSVLNLGLIVNFIAEEISKRKKIDPKVEFYFIFQDVDSNFKYYFSSYNLKDKKMLKNSDIFDICKPKQKNNIKKLIHRIKSNVIQDDSYPKAIYQATGGGESVEVAEACFDYFVTKFGLK